jgi:hypothetical protein
MEKTIPYNAKTEEIMLQAYITVQYICLRFFRVLEFHEQ